MAKESQRLECVNFSKAKARVDISSSLSALRHLKSKQFQFNPDSPLFPPRHKSRNGNLAGIGLRFNTGGLCANQSIRRIFDIVNRAAWPAQAH
jgi:hypothetical protein